MELYSTVNSSQWGHGSASNVTEHKLPDKMQQIGQLRSQAATFTLYIS